MEFRLLGPLEVRQGDRVLRLGTGKQRALLALLVLHRNEALSTERLVDGLWGERPPETAAKIVQNYVSLLRRSFAEHDGDREVILTRGHGYLLRIEASELDVDRFEELVADGREALSEGRPEEASSLLREALALWRGPALADVAYEPFAQAEANRLEERRLVALEHRIEADLGLGRHADLVGELESLAAKHPLRERLHGQLLLALYRSGRQAEALEAYRRARRHLVDDLGIEPSQELRDLDQAVLRQDPSLGAPAPAGPAVHPRRRRKLVYLAIALLAVVSAVALFASRRDEERAPPASIIAPPNSVAVIDPATNAVSAAIRVGNRPGPIAIGGGSVWAANVEDETLTRIDLRTRTVVATIGLGVEPTGLAASNGAVWVAAGFDRALLRVDAELGRVGMRVNVREEIGPLPAGFEVGPSGVALANGAVWLSHGEEVSKIDPATGRVLATIPAGGSWTGAITAGEGALWVTENDRLRVRRLRGSDWTGVVRIDPRSANVSARVAIPGLRAPSTAGTLSPGALAAGERALWAAATATDQVSRIDAETTRVLSTLRGGNEPASVTVGEGAVWVENHNDQNVVRLDPFSNELVATIDVGGATRGIVAGGGAVWVSVVG